MLFRSLRDRLLLWSLVVLVALALLLLRTGTFAGHVQAQETLRLLEPLTSAPAFLALAAALAALSLVVVIRWIAAERRALLTPAQRAPRLVFIGSTVLLFAVFVVHGPVVGYLSFGAAHAIEYIAFVHHFGERKYQSRAERNVAAYLLSRPLVFAPLLVSGLGIVYFRLLGYAVTDTYLTYYVGHGS